MQKIKMTRKIIIQVCCVAGLFFILLFCALAQKICLGQKYQQVYYNGEWIGNVSGYTDVDALMHQVRRKIAKQSSTPVCMDYEYSCTQGRRLFTPILSENALKETIEEKMKVSEVDSLVRAYTVAIEGYRGNFASIDEVLEFLNTVKDKADTDGQFKTRILKEEGHIGGIARAVLKPVNVSEETENEPEETLADKVLAGANAAFCYQMEYADANPSDNSYETGILDMGFVEKVEVYEKYVSQDELSDIPDEVEEVTKDKETNKIYVVQSGDVLSVIAMDHDTTVANIVALNGFDNAEARIYPGQEIIIAVPEPDLSLRVKQGEVYEEDYNAEPTIIKNDAWYTTEQVVHQEGTTGHRERNDIVTYENGIEVSRVLAHQTIMVESVPAIIEQGTITPPTYIKPLAGGHFTSGFGRRWGRMHKGVDWGCPVGTTVYASSAGTVVSAGYNGGYGNNVVISHPDGRMTRYAHNSKLLVSAGQWVEQGQSIALSGSTGRSTGPHVHFEIYINGVAVNPLKYIGQ